MLIHDFSARLATGQERRFADYRGKVLLMVNVASKCGFTPQYSGLQALYKQLHPRGFEILAFPCDQFGHQEPGSDAEIVNFCDNAYGVTFPLFAKIEVNGKNAHPLYVWLKQQKRGLLGKRIKWNSSCERVSGHRQNRKALRVTWKSFCRRGNDFFASNGNN